MEISKTIFEIVILYLNFTDYGPPKIEPEEDKGNVFNCPPNSEDRLR